MKEELRQQWLWMVAVNFACEQLVKWTMFDLLLEEACS